MEIGVVDSLHCVAFVLLTIHPRSGDGSLAASGDLDGFVSVFAVDTMRMVLRVQAHSLFVTDLAFWQTSDAPPAHSVLSVSADRRCVRTKVEARSSPLLLALLGLLFLAVAVVVFLTVTGGGSSLAPGERGDL